jgi:AcrR family transcriptional regulator
MAVSPVDEGLRMSEQPPARRLRGRPRSAPIDQALLDAAVAEFVANGFHTMSMESIATRAGVSKVTLYRRWRSKYEVAADVLRMLSDTKVPDDHGSLEADLIALFSNALGSPEARRQATVFMRTMGEITGDPALLDLYRRHLLRPRIGQIRVLLDRARDRNEIDRSVSSEAAAAMIAGPLVIYHLALLAEPEMTWPDNLAEEFTRRVLVGIGSEKRSRRSKARGA